MTDNLKHFDLFVIGGGINGTGVAVDAAGRGLSTCLVEMNDFASATSSASSKLIHGGLRYLENYEFGLVRKSLAEREVMLAKAPHIIQPLAFRLPHQSHLRPAWMIRCGLLMYDNLAKRNTLPGSKGVRFTVKDPLKKTFRKGFEYSDASVDDARLVLLNAKMAEQKGATVYNYVRCVGAVRKDGQWLISLKNQLTGVDQKITAKAMVNASGPWVAELFDDVIEQEAPKPIRRVRGSHIIVPKLHDKPEAFLLQNADGRVVFVIPFEENFSLIGTTDIEHTGDPSLVKISDEETDYLLSISNDYFKTQVQRSDIVHSFSGVRPLISDDADSAQSVSRDYRLEKSHEKGRAPLLSIYGGKLTTYRVLAEEVLAELKLYFPKMAADWTATAPLPGGDFESREQLNEEYTVTYPWLSKALRNRFVRSYGRLTEVVLQGCSDIADLGERIGADLYEREMEYLIQHEWAKTAEDIIWRRSKLGLRMSSAEKAKVDYFVQKQTMPIPESA